MRMTRKILTLFLVPVLLAANMTGELCRDSSKSGGSCGRPAAGGADRQALCEEEAVESAPGCCDSGNEPAANRCNICPCLCHAPGMLATVQIPSRTESVSILIENSPSSSSAPSFELYRPPRLS